MAVSRAKEHVGDRPLSRGNRISQEHCHGHRPDPTGYRSNERCLLAYAFEVDVSNNAAIRKAINANINYDRARFHHLWKNQVRMAGRNDENFRKNCGLSEIARLCVTYAQRCVTLHQHERHRFADDVARSNHHDILPFKLNPLVFKHPENAARRARGNTASPATSAPTL